VNVGVPTIVVTPTSASEGHHGQQPNDEDHHNFHHPYSPSHDHGDSSPDDATIMALENLLEGIQVVKRILQRSSPPSPEVEDSYHSGRCCGTASCHFSKDSHRMWELSNQLVGILGSNLLGLYNAASMVRDRATLQSEENVILLRELHHVQQLCLEAHLWAEQADTINVRLYNEKQTLVRQVQQLQAERRILVKECKTLRQVVEDTRKFDTWRLLEEHVLDSVAIHEHVLLKTKAPSNTTNDKSGEEKLHEDEKDLQVDILDNSRKETPPLPFSTLAVIVHGGDDHDHVENGVAASVGCEESVAVINQRPSVDDTQKGHREDKEAAPKKRSFFSRFTVMSQDGGKASGNNHFRKPKERTDDAVEQTPSSAAEGIPSHNGERASYTTSEATMPPTPDDGILKEDENLALNVQAGECHDTRRRFWYHNHLSIQNNPSQTASKTDTTPNPQEKISASAHEQETEVSKEKYSDSVTDTSKNTEERSFAFDRTYRVVVPENGKYLTETKSLGTGCTESSHSDTLESDLNTPGRDMPRSVSFRFGRVDSDSLCTSPLLTPEESPECFSFPNLKPMCDPSVIRTLAIPSNASNGSWQTSNSCN
jgi:hypothetical protein